jgi:hypothetical protein
VSDACPENATLWPTRQRRVAAGVSMTGDGGVLPTVMVTLAVSCRPPASVTRSLAV